MTCCGAISAEDKSTGQFNDFDFTGNLPSSATLNKRVLLGTAGFEAAHGIRPDYVIPDNYLATGPGDVWYNAALEWSSLTTDGWQSYKAGGEVSAATPTNFDGDTVTLTEPVSATTATQFLMTTSDSANITTLHIVNQAEEAKSFTGTLYNGDGDQLGSADVPLGAAAVPAKGRLTLGASDLELLFNATPWKGPAMLELKGSATFSLMSKLISPSGLISNTNCVRDTRVLNIEGADSEDMTFVRFINTGDTAITDIRGTLYDQNGVVIGTANTQLLESLASKQAVWINRNNFISLFGASWDAEAMLEVGEVDNLKLLNLNFVNGETFFNFSCFETSGTSGDVYLMTRSDGFNVSKLHIVNTSDTYSQSFTGTLYSGDGSPLGSATRPLHEGSIPPSGRVVLLSQDLELIFGVSPWSGPAMLRVNGSREFELMIKLESPSGLISKTNCVRRDEVHNIEGFDSQDMTFVRFINVGTGAISNITGTLYDSNGNLIGSADTLLLETLAPHRATWLNRNNLSDLFGGATWNGEALLKVSSHDDLRLLNLNFANSETFFNFSCYETSQ